VLVYAVKSGITPDEFWHSSLNDTLLLVDGFIYRHKVDLREGVTEAWLTAAWGRAKKLPQLRQVLNKLEQASAPPKTKEEVKEDMDKMVADMMPGAKTLEQIEAERHGS
jgi:hypothetical protein